MIVTGVRTFLPGECLPPHLWILAQHSICFDSRGRVKDRYMHILPLISLLESFSSLHHRKHDMFYGVNITALHGKRFLPQYLLFEQLILLFGTRRPLKCVCARARVCVCVCVYVCVCIIDWHCKRWCHCNRFSFLFMVFLKDKYDGSVVYVDLDMTICKQPQSYPCTL